MPNMSLKKNEMPSQEPNVRNKNFLEVALGYTEEQALDEAARCLNCKNHPCVSGCPVQVKIPEFIKKITEKDYEGAYQVIHETSSLPTSSGTGSEVTPFAIITDKDTGIKWPLADYALLPNMAIVDVDNAMTAPKGLTSASGIDVMTHAIESYVSIMASDYTKGLSMKAAKLVFDNLPSSYENGANDPHAREEMHNASCMAGMAFANAFLGLNHSMAHKLGAFHHLPHGIANAVILTRVMRYNAAEAPVKMGTFSQYPYPNALAAYAEMARYCGVEGKDDREVFENFCAKLEELKATIGIKETIADYGVDEAYFLETLDEMVEQAFNDQCTGANPRYPLMSEIKELYLDAYYGREPQDYAVL